MLHTNIYNISDNILFMVPDIVAVGGGSTIRFVDLDGCYTDRESMLRTIQQYCSHNMWPKEFETSVFTFRKPESLIVTLLQQGEKNPYTYENLTDIRATCQVEPKRALITLPQIMHSEGSNDQNHELTHIPQRLGRKTGVRSIPVLHALAKLLANTSPLGDWRL